MKARTAVIPFFRGTAVGDMFFSLAFSERRDS